MSEFECRQGHLVAPSQMIKGRYCPECGEPIVRMDGLSSRQWQEIDVEWQKRIDRKLEEECEREENEEEIEEDGINKE